MNYCKAVQEEIDRRKQWPEMVQFKTTKELNNHLKTLGYKLDRDMDCHSMAVWNTGESYPCVTTDIKEIDTGLSFAHFEARRDDNFKKLQELRGKGCFVAFKDYLFEI